MGKSSVKFTPIPQPIIIKMGVTRSAICMDDPKSANDEVSVPALAHVSNNISCGIYLKQRILPNPSCFWLPHWQLWRVPPHCQQWEVWWGQWRSPSPPKPLRAPLYCSPGYMHMAVSYLSSAYSVTVWDLPKTLHRSLWELRRRPMPQKLLVKWGCLLLRHHQLPLAQTNKITARVMCDFQCKLKPAWISLPNLHVWKIENTYIASVVFCKLSFPRQSRRPTRV